MGECLRALIRDALRSPDEIATWSEEARAKEEQHAAAGGLVLADAVMSTKRLTSIVEAIARGLSG